MSHLMIMIGKNGIKNNIWMRVRRWMPAAINNNNSSPIYGIDTRKPAKRDTRNATPTVSVMSTAVRVSIPPAGKASQSISNSVYEKAIRLVISSAIEMRIKCHLNSIKWPSRAFRKPAGLCVAFSNV